MTKLTPQMVGLAQNRAIEKLKGFCDSPTYIKLLAAELSADLNEQLGQQAAALGVGSSKDRIGYLRDMLEKCSDQFAFYAQQHKDKGTPEGDEKAITNDNFVEWINAVLVADGDLARAALAVVPPPVCWKMSDAPRRLREMAAQARLGYATISPNYLDDVAAEIAALAVAPPPVGSGRSNTEIAQDLLVQAEGMVVADHLPFTARLMREAAAALSRAKGE